MCSSDLSGEHTTDMEVRTQTAETSRSELQEKSIYSMEFRTSNYNTFAQKLNGLSYSDGITWELYPLVHSLTVNISGERFDTYEVTNRDSTRMISCQILLQETPWYKSKIEPIVNIGADGLSLIGAKPFNPPALTSYFFQENGTRNLTEEEINQGFSDKVEVLSGIKYYLAKYSCEYIQSLQSTIAKQFGLGNIPATGGLNELFHANFTPLKYGDYPIQINYTLPEKNAPQSSKKHIINYND